MAVEVVVARSLPVDIMYISGGPGGPKRAVVVKKRAVVMKKGGSGENKGGGG